MDWEACYQSGDTPWDKNSSAPELGHALKKGYLRGSVLVPGCGRGHDVRAIAAVGAGAVVGLDLAPSAIRAAREMGAPSGSSFMDGNLFALPEEYVGIFDWVWEHTCFCALPPSLRPDYVRAVYGALRSGGRLLALFFLDPGMDSPEQGPPFGVTTAELDVFFAEGFVLEAEWLPHAAYPGREGRELVRLLRRV